MPFNDNAHVVFVNEGNAVLQRRRHEPPRSVEEAQSDFDNIVLLHNSMLGKPATTSNWTAIMEYRKAAKELLKNYPGIVVTTPLDLFGDSDPDVQQLKEMVAICLHEKE